MKALYTNKSKYEVKDSLKELKTYDYNTRYQALKDGYTFVHLFESSINDDQLEIEYYSTMKL